MSPFYALLGVGGLLGTAFSCARSVRRSAGRRSRDGATMSGERLHPSRVEVEDFPHEWVSTTGTTCARSWPTCKGTSGTTWATPGSGTPARGPGRNAPRPLPATVQQASGWFAVSRIQASRVAAARPFVGDCADPRGSAMLRARPAARLVRLPIAGTRSDEPFVRHVRDALVLLYDRTAAADPRAPHARPRPGCPPGGAGRGPGAGARPPLAAPTRGGARESGRPRAAGACASALGSP
jgi:hypothetical protein